MADNLRIEGAQMRTSSLFCAAVTIVLSTFAFGRSAEAATVRMSWDPSTGPDVTGYVVAWRLAGAATDQVVDVGNVTTWSLRNLTSGQTYVISVRAYTSLRVQSAPAQVSVVAAMGVDIAGGSARLAIGQTARWTASGWGFDSTVEYLFRRYSTAGGWVTVRNWGTSASYSWTPTNAQTGMYVLEVWARQIGSSASFEAQTSTGYFAVGAATPLMALPSRMDFDGDGRVDPAVFRPSTGAWWGLLSSTGYSAALSRQWGVSTDVPVPGDYDGDGRTDLAVFRPATGMWYALLSSSGYSTSLGRQWGASTDTPVPGDYDGDGRTDFAVFRPSNGAWYVLLSSSGYSATLMRNWGIGTDVPVPGDYDGDRRTDIAVFRPSTGTWFVLESISNFSTVRSRAWGIGTDRPTPADYDGDGRTDFAVFRPSSGTWYVLQSSSGYSAFFARPWGVATDLPVPGDYDGDGRADTAVFRPGSGIWYVWNQFSRAWGMATDIPLLMK